jgi:hypothetical protein
MALFMTRWQHRAALHHIILPERSHDAVYDEVAAGLPCTIFSYLNDPMTLFMMRWQHRAALHHILLPGLSHDAVYDEVASQGCPAPYFLTWTIP